MMVDGYILVKGIKGIECGNCLSFVWSRHEEDTQTCKCRATEITGGQFDLDVKRLRPFAKVSYHFYDILINLETGHETLLPTDNLAGGYSYDEENY
jgi:hypothetical protein